jgi:hypothetical protein
VASKQIKDLERDERGAINGLPPDCHLL